MRDWNVIISIYQDGFRRAQRALETLGSVEPSSYHNVLVMKVDDPMALLDAVEQRTEEIPALYDAISRVAPAQRAFEFHSAEEFRDKARDVLCEWVPQLAGRSFHVRFHRRGARHDLGSAETERYLDDVILDALREVGTPATISFADADAVIAIDTIDERAGLALWTRENLTRHRLLRPD
jgi:tRNA(Ser,Leu) C12 N-acetylase TAN1